MSDFMRRPAIKSGMGNWNYYVSTMTFEQIVQFVKMPSELCKTNKLDSVLLNNVTTSIQPIVKYLTNEKERLFNSLVLAVCGGTVKWYEGVFEYKEELFYNIGVLEFSRDVCIFPADGKYRVAAIKEAIGNDNIDERHEEVPVIFIAHCDDEEGMKRTKCLSLNLNNRVNKDELYN